jgi:hypothetical protein
MKLRKWIEEIPRGRRAFHKDCQVVDIDLVSERYALLTLQIPLPVGGEHRELVSVETEIEIRKVKNEMPIGKKVKTT